DNSKTDGAYDNVNDMQLRFGHAYTDASEIDAQSYFGRDGVEFINYDTDLGWNLEVKLPLAGIFLEPVADSEFGFEIQGNDNDATAREHITKWWTEVGDPSWNNASTFGTAFLSPRPVAVDEKAPVARNFGLSQNYPNPFNPTTTVPYSLKSAGKVRLSVFDMMGREVAVLADGIMPAGSHTAQFTANNLSSGIYFCKLQTADNVMTTKMTLVK
ncbi:T9SS type A sorting domain-containing protein, partial [bacterium]|nr:T9SS type A sorting domain-containing protein [bacterium]